MIVYIAGMLVEELVLPVLSAGIIGVLLALRRMFVRRVC